MQWRYGLVASCLLLMSFLLTGCDMNANALFQGRTTPTPLPVVQSRAVVLAEGRIVPRRSVRLSPAAMGEVAQILVTEGDTVTSGQVLLRIQDAQQRAAVAEAEAMVKVAEAQLAQARTGPQPEQVAAAEAAVSVARSGVQTAEGNRVAAEARLSKLKAGATEEDLAVGQRRVEAAKNALWSAQAQRDSICGQKGAPAANCDAANGAVLQAEEGVRIAELQLQQTTKGATPQDLQAAQAQVQAAQGQWESAKASQAQAEALLALLRKGATKEALAVVEAQVGQARAALERARASLADTELRAPLAGQVAKINAKVGEKVSAAAPAVQLADLGSWQVETDDLTEREVVRVSVGQTVSVVPDALPELKIPGAVEAIQNVYEDKKGDVTYTVRVRLDGADPRLRWGMTVKISFD